MMTAIEVAPASTDSPLNNQNTLFSDKSLTFELKVTKKPFALRMETIKRIFEVMKSRFAEIAELSGRILSENSHLSCPVHGHNYSSIKNGHDTNGAQKYICKAKHERENIICLPVASNVEFVVYREVNSADGRLYFRSTTSYEALHLYAKSLRLSLDMVLNGTTIEFVVDLLGFSKALVEKALDALANVEPTISLPENIDERDLIVVYMDFSSSGISRIYGIVAVVINGRPSLLISVGESYMQAYSILNTLKKALEEKMSLRNKVVIVITDGSQAYPTAVREIFPTEIHVRQIHNKEQRGIVLVHFSVLSGHEYTIRMRWDAFSEEPHNGPILDLEEKDSGELYLGRLDVGDPHGFSRCRKKGKKAKRKPVIGSKIRGATLIFRGRLEEMKRSFHFVHEILAILAIIFAGMFITTNNVEHCFGIKSLICPHRATRGHARILKCLLIYHSELRKQFPGGRSIVLNLSLGKSSRPPPKMRIIADAVKMNRDLIITYVDKRGNSIYRLITPCGLYTRGNVVYLRAYCHLRNAYRTFRVDRIQHVEIAG